MLVRNSTSTVHGTFKGVDVQQIQGVEQYWVILGVSSQEVGALSKLHRGGGVKAFERNWKGARRDEEKWFEETPQDEKEAD